MQRSVLEYLENSAERFPQKIVFADTEHEITYEELVRQAKVIGTTLAVRNKIEKGSPVVVFIDRNIESLIAFFGVAYGGCFYVPVDNQMPTKRIALIFDTLKPKAVVLKEKQQKILEELQYEGCVLKYEELSGFEIDESGIASIRKRMLDTDPLYAIFTSGSTGVPKGVLVGHQSVIDLIDNFKEEFGFDETMILGNQAPFDFDVSVKDIYSTIKNGGTMYVIPKVMFSFPGKLISYLNEKKINTVIWATSALRIIENLKALDKELPEYLRIVMFSGEVMPNRVLNYWRGYLPDVLYVNLYGPTEITCNCTFYKVDRPFQDDEPLPIGISFENTEVLLLDENNRLAKEGEICVRGTSLALGYYNNPSKTAEAFCQNPLNTAYPERIYRTGDLGRYDEDGNLMFISRKDYQIKHMGHRIELGEIEVVANALPMIDAAVCIYDDTNEKIVMFYQSQEKCDREVLQAMGKSLPKYMFPNKLCWFESLPMNKNGKFDRVALKKQYIGN